VSDDTTRSDVAIHVEGLVHRYEPLVPAVSGVDLDIQAGDYVAIVGQNGSGKTTLIKHFNGLLKPTAGRVVVFGRDTARATVGELARQVGYVFQNPDHQIFCATTREEIAFGPRNLGLGDDEIRDRTAGALQAFGLDAHAETPPAVLGYGLRRKVTLAAVYAMRPRVFVLDEPTVGLDWRSAQELLALVDQLHAQGHTIVLVSHDMRLVAEHARRTVIMHQGSILMQGPTRHVFTQREVLRRAQLTPPPVTRLAQRLADEGVPGDRLTVEELCCALDERLARGRP
jgi:energy-coupling factor transport system ATP-binding protein